MAHQLFGKFTDTSFHGITRLSGVLGSAGGGPDSFVGVEGTLSSSGYFSAAKDAGNGLILDRSVIGGTWLIASGNPISIALPAPTETRSLRFILGQAPSSGHHEIDAGDYEIHGGISVVNAVPSGLFATGQSRIRFNHLADDPLTGRVPVTRGARISLYSHGGTWYVADGLAFEAGAVSFA